MIKLTRRWLRLRLRTLFVLVTLICVFLVLGLQVNRVRQQKASIAYLESIGATISYHHEEYDPPGPNWLYGLLIGEEYFKNVEAVKVTNEKAIDIARLSGLRQIENLELRLTPVKNLQSLKNLRTLKSLLDHRCNLADLSGIGECSNLLELRITESSVGSLAELSRLSKLRTLSIHSTSLIKDLTPLGSNSQLEQLFIRGLLVTDLSPLAQLTNLKIVDLWDSHAKDYSDLRYLQNLEVLVLKWASISDISFLTEMQSLERVDLEMTNVADLSPLWKLPNLKFVSAPFSDKEKDQLQNALANLVIRRVTVGPSGANILRAHFTRTSFIWPTLEALDQMIDVNRKR